MNARHWLLAKDSYRAEVHMQPLHYKNAEGAWQPGSGQAHVFVGDDTGYVHVLNAETGSPVTGLYGESVLVAHGFDGNGNVLPMNGPIRASMAAYRGRLYILTMGTVAIPWPTLYCFADFPI